VPASLAAWSPAAALAAAHLAAQPLPTCPPSRRRFCNTTLVDWKSSLTPEELKPEVRQPACGRPPALALRQQPAALGGAGGLRALLPQQQLARAAGCGWLADAAARPRTSPAAAGVQGAAHHGGVL
jgi:hypothetical protein